MALQMTEWGRTRGQTICEAKVGFKQESPTSSLGLESLISVIDSIVGLDYQTVYLNMRTGR